MDCLLTLHINCLVPGVCQHLAAPLPRHNACYICCSHASLESCAVAAGLCSWDIPIFCYCILPANLHGIGCCCHGLTCESCSSATPLSPAAVPCDPAAVPCDSVLLLSFALPCPALPCPALPSPALPCPALVSLGVLTMQLSGVMHCRCMIQAQSLLCCLFV